MAAAATYCVEMIVVIANAKTDNKLREAIAELEQLADDYPFLPVQEPLDKLTAAYEELINVSDR